MIVCSSDCFDFGWLIVLVLWLIVYPIISFYFLSGDLDNCFHFNPKSYLCSCLLITLFIHTCHDSMLQLWKMYNKSSRFAERKTVPLIIWLINSLNNIQINLLIDLLTTDSLIGWLTNSLIDWLTDPLTNWLTDWFTLSLTHWLTGSLTYSLAPLFTC